jgi:hypothetical protein
MQEQARKQTSQPEAAHDIPLAQEREAAVEQQPAVTTAPPVASFAELTGQKAEQGQAQAPLANEEAVIEQLAHGMVAKDLDDKDQAFLAANGYEALPIIRGSREFVMRTFIPTRSGKAPIVAFRGTVPTKVKTIIADLDPTGIGMYQFNPNRALIEGQMAAAHSHGPIISSGHSLGGALAQIAAANYPGMIDRIVTFQAPGVSAEMAKKIADYNEEHPDQKIESSHHRVEGDLVPQGGEALTPGTIHNHKMTDGNLLQKNALTKHIALPLAQEEMAAGHDVPIHNDRTIVPTGDESTETANAEKNLSIEHARKGLGKLVYGVGRIH